MEVILQSYKNSVLYRVTSVLLKNSDLFAGFLYIQYNCNWISCKFLLYKVAELFEPPKCCSGHFLGQFVNNQ